MNKKYLKWSQTQKSYKLSSLKNSMPENYSQEPQYQSDTTLRIQDLEEKQRLLKERVVLFGNSLIEKREKNFEEMQEMKKIILKLKEDNLRMKEFIQRMSDLFSELARKEELMILQRQFEMFTKSKSTQK